MSSLPVLVAHEAELYLWDMENEEFLNQGIVTAKIVQQKGSGFEYWLTASSDNGQLLAHKITQDMNQRWSNKMLTLTWNHLGDNGSQRSWLFRFGEQVAYDTFLRTFMQSLWEALHQASWTNIKVCKMLYTPRFRSSNPSSARRAKLHS
jgi:hypothetical protein